VRFWGNSRRTYKKKGRCRLCAFFQLGSPVSAVFSCAARAGCISSHLFHLFIFLSFAIVSKKQKKEHHRNCMARFAVKALSSPTPPPKQNK
jgi:hypothetical protein